MQKGPGTLRGHPTPSCSSVRRSRSARLAAHCTLGSLPAVGTTEGLHHAVTGNPGGGDCGEDRDADRHDPSCQLCQTLQHDDLLSPSLLATFSWPRNKKAPTGTNPDRGLDAARPSAFYIDYDALTAFRSLKVQKKRRISLSGPDHDQIDRHFCELLPWPPGTSLLPTSAASVLPKAKRPPEGTIPPEGLKTELGLLCPTLFIPAVARFR